MELSSIIHEAKSSLSYAYDTETLHIRIKTKKDDIDKITLIACDPFYWVQDEKGDYHFEKETLIEKNMIKEYSTQLHDVWFVELNEFNWLRVKYIFKLHKDNEKVFFGSKDIMPATDDINLSLSNYFNYPYINYEDVYTAPSWVKDTIWYQIFPDRFNNGDNTINPVNMETWGKSKRNDVDTLFGGDLQGVINKLDYIKDLGISGIYFTPIFEASTSHKYDTNDYFKIDKSFGDNETFGLLVKEAHKRGIKVMLDAVFNHCGHNHPYWQDVLKNGKNSKYFDWFYILDENKDIQPYVENEKITKEMLEQLNYRTFAFTKTMPKWNTGNKETEEYLLSVATYWINEYDIDGWRIDVSNEVSHDFWRKFKIAVTEAKKDVYILGENWDNSNPWLQGDQFHAVMNYEFSTSVLNFIGIKDIANTYTATDFMYGINKVLTDYPKYLHSNMFNMLDSHDTPRLLHVCNEDIERAKLCYAIQMAFSGGPSIYYGGEVGISGDSAENRRCMLWNKEEQDLDLLSYLKKLISLRNNYDILKAIDLKWIYVNDDEKSLIIEKTHNNQKLYILINASEEDITITLPTEMQNNSFKELIYDNAITLNNTIKIPKLSAMYLI